jgi:glycosyltransferase involved in cell wall biosynthesis
MIESLDFDPGGAERVVTALATELPRERFDVTLCTTQRREAGPLLAQVRAAEVRVLELERRGRWDVLRWRRLVTFLRRERVDVLHAHMWGSNFWASVLGRACRVPVVIAHEHAWAYEGSPLRRLVDRFVIGRLADRFLTVANRDRIVQWERVPAHKVEVVPNPYLPRPGASDGDVRAELGIDAGAPVVGTIARLRPVKALEVLLDAFALVSRSLPDARLVIAGDGPTRPQLEERAELLGISARTHFLGMRDDVDAVLRAIDVAAISSDAEGAPLLGLECMVNRTPLVATDVGGVPEMFESGRTAVLVGRRDGPALADAIESLLRDPRRREAIAEAAHAELAPYMLDRVIERYVELYERLLGESRRGARGVTRGSSSGGRES